ncbi:hypothetical protein WKG85_09125 [Pantoea agglomerans]|uniref:hypothetical protein n=1 Tax=Enterobacter agglomerans TaxID=549 RepID=UPI003C7C626B
MATNPKIQQGVLNRIRASIKFSDAPELNVSASYLAKEGIGLTFQGEIVVPLPTMTGIAQSPQPYIMAQAKVPLVRSQALGTQYKERWEINGILGNCRLYSDSKTFGDFDLFNTSITSCGDMTFAGGEPGVLVTLTGIYYVNSDMWDL